MKPNFHLNKKKNSILLSFIFLLLLTNVNFLLSQQFNAYVNPNPVPEGELFQVTYVLKAEGNKFEPPKFKNFTLVNGPSTSSEYSFINGRTSRQTKYTYTLRADKKGEFNIEPATVVVDGKTIQSNTTKLSVIEPSQALKDRRKQEAETNKSLNQQANEIISKNLFAKATINKNSAYIGEQLIATYKIYINEQLNLVDLAMTKTPSFVGFWTQSFDEKQLNYDREIINGVPFKVAVVKQVLLFPQQSGNLTLDEMDFKSKVRLRTSGGN
ncbi:MAG: BatD family protein [Candidatus Kapaibacteriota bacterium]